MTEVKLPSSIKVGGIDFSIERSPEHNKELHALNLWGECSPPLQRIRLASDTLPQIFGEVAIHEILHAIDHIYVGKELTERQIEALAQGLFQVMEQLGVRFVK